MYIRLSKYLGADPPPTVYGPLAYGNYSVTVDATSTSTLEVITVTCQGTSVE